LQKRIQDERAVYFTGIAYVTFRTKEQKDLVQEQLGSDAGFVRAMCFNTSNKSLSINGKTSRYSLKEAYDPSDIKWENQGIKKRQIFFYRLVTYFLSLLVLGVSFGIILGLKVAQKKITDEALLSNNSTSFSSFSFRLLSVAIGLVVTLINGILSMVMRMLTEFERPPTQTSLMSSLSLKIMFVSKPL
jgi:hypothetical protein